MRTRPIWVLFVALACVDREPRLSPGDESNYLRLERSECLADCPVYSVTIYASGLVRLDPRKNMPSGTKWRKVAPARVAGFMDDFDRVPAWECDPSRIVTDLGQAVVTLSRRGRVRRIVYDHGDPCAPDQIRWLEGAIDLAGGSPHALPRVLSDAEKDRVGDASVE